MIIVKLTILSITITMIYAFLVKLWASSEPKKALKAIITKKYPKWLHGITILIFLDILGVLLSVIWLLFIR